MSRSAHKKQPPRAPVKPPKRRGSDSSSSSLNLSDDDGYSAVEDISDSDEDDEGHVYAAEEEHIISNELQQSSQPPRPQPDDADDADEEDDDEHEVPDDDEDEEDEAMQGSDGDDNASWDGILSDIDGGAAATADAASAYILDQDVTNVERRVRFTGVPDSDSDSTTTDTTEEIEGFFPDIFVKQSSLDPAFRREIEYDPDESSNSGSFWDFHSTYEPYGADSDSDDGVNGGASLQDVPNATPVASHVPTDFSIPISPGPVQELDGYETDGDTTEDDVPDPLVRKKQIRRSHSADASSDSDMERPVRFRRGQPRVGRYNLDSSDQKPVAVVNPISRKMMIFTPQRLRRLDLAPESFNLDFFTNPALIQSSPILSNSASLMMSAMFSSNTFGDFMNTQAIGPTEAFFSLASDGITADNSEDSEAEQEDDEEKNLRLEDFITFNEETSGAEDGDNLMGDAWDDGAQTDVASTPARPQTFASAIGDATMDKDVHPLLAHFEENTDAVGAFRRNQVDQQLLLSDKASQDSLAFSGPYYHGTLRGIKSGSIETVTTPITPIRRQKRNSVTNGMSGVQLTGLSSVLEGSPTQKRKASSPHHDAKFHKRYRSISDVEGLVL